MAFKAVQQSVMTPEVPVWFRLWSIWWDEHEQGLCAGWEGCFTLLKCQKFCLWCSICDHEQCTNRYVCRLRASSILGRGYVGCCIEFQGRLQWSIEYLKVIGVTGTWQVLVISIQMQTESHTEQLSDIVLWPWPFVQNAQHSWVLQGVIWDPLLTPNAFFFYLQPPHCAVVFHYPEKS